MSTLPAKISSIFLEKLGKESSLPDTDTDGRLRAGKNL